VPKPIESLRGVEVDAVVAGEYHIGAGGQRKSVRVGPRECSNRGCARPGPFSGVRCRASGAHAAARPGAACGMWPVTGLALNSRACVCVCVYVYTQTHAHHTDTLQHTVAHCVGPRALS
jgi:hypothetical protein